MIQIRKGVFETNSSSTHSIVISKAPVAQLPSFVKFTPREYGWENRCVGDTASYLYTGILDNGNSDARLEKLASILDELGINYKFLPPTKNRYGWLECGIDHSYELNPFIDAVLDNKDLLIRFLFGDSCVYTGNDNQDPVPDGCDIADETYWVYENGDDCREREVKNPYHDEEHYEYFCKGN